MCTFRRDDDTTARCTDQVVIITEAGRGIGREPALAFAEECTHVHVMLAGRRRDALDIEHRG